MVIDRPTPAAEEHRATWPGIIRHKKHIGPLALILLGVAGCLPMLLAFSRVLALPWGESLTLRGLDWLRALGTFLNQHVTLEWVPPSDRAAILYLLLLPTGALLVTVARLTLGIRVLGLRAILIAIGFRAIGILPSLALIVIVVGAIVLIRPWLRRIRLPMYARIPVILCLSAMIMLSALFVAPRLGSETIWRVAFFPVIIMGMIAESVAKTLEKDDTVLAVWRAAGTIGLALVIILIDRAVSRFSYQFPELILTQLVAIVFIAEFLDLRLLEEWPARLSRYFAGIRPWYTARPRVAVVRNRDAGRVIARLGRPAPASHRKQSVQRQVDALREQGFEVKVFEGDSKLLGELADFLPPHPRRGTSGGIVLNLATGVQGEGRFCHVPAMLELAGVPYTGPDPVGHARLGDRFALLTLLGQAQVPVPRHCVVADPAASVDVDFPASARPRYEPDADRTVVGDRRALRAAVRDIRRSYRQPAVVEEIVGGRKISVSLLGNETLECLPLLESTGKDGRTCPAPLGEAAADQIRACARAAYRAAGCRDYARIDIRLSAFDDPVVTDVRWADLFERRGAFVTSAEAAGYTFATLMRRIVGVAAGRYVVRARRRSRSTSPVALAEQRLVPG